ncbi:MAG: DUF2181 domain-containing protein [Candidatus Latescibacteria bacterium]|nr:DUF2181 domain-containing protein [Candidatus Latescibacterota bacterium]
MKTTIEFFHTASPWNIVWAHGVNSAAMLDRMLNDPNIMMIEGDVSSNENGDIIMAHPPEKSSDLLFFDWVRRCVSAGKGIKPDFKEAGIIDRALEFIADEGIRVPVFVNADVIAGPNCDETVIDPDWFISLCRRYLPASVLSLGFCVGAGADYSFHEKQNMVQSMRNTALACTGDVTICLCTSYLRDNYELFLRYLFDLDVSFTLWNFEPVTHELAEWIKDRFPEDRCFYDFKDQTGEPLRI